VFCQGGEARLVVRRETHAEYLSRDVDPALPVAAYLGGRPRPGRMGAMDSVLCLRGPDHLAGTA
jgi:hypothetical protein